MEIISALPRLFFYPPPPSVLVTAMSVISGASLANAGFMELRGKNMPYSKFWNVDNDVSRRKESTSGAAAEPKETAAKLLSSRTGMLICYAPAFLAGVASFVFYSNEDFRFVLLCSAIAIHFFKRIFEVLFIHKYISWMRLDAALPISFSYFISTATMVYAQHLAREFPEPSVDLKYVGILFFLMGISGNFYHHYLLSNLRKKDKEVYKIPRGGLFNLVICPHYLFEILGFIGITCISQTFYAFSFTLGTTAYLMGRSFSTKNWYLSKFEDFPKDVKALIPYIF